MKNKRKIRDWVQFILLFLLICYYAYSETKRKNNFKSPIFNTTTPLIFPLNTDFSKNSKNNHYFMQDLFAFCLQIEN